MTIEMVNPRKSSFYSIEYPVDAILLYFDMVFQNATQILDPVVGVVDELFIASVEGPNRPYDPKSEYLRNMLVFPIYAFSWFPFDDTVTTGPGFLHPNDRAKTTGYYATAIYRILISTYSLYLFTSLALCSLQSCGAVFIYFWLKGGLVPNQSQFAEVDFASKCQEVLKDGQMSLVLRGLSNAESGEIIQRVKGKEVYVGAVSRGGGIDEIVLATNECVSRLQSRRRYL